MASVSVHFGGPRATEAQLRRLFAIAWGSREEPGVLSGTTREKWQQLNEIIRRYGYDWDAVDTDGHRDLWLKRGDYDQIIGELLVISGRPLTPRNERRARPRADTD